MKKIKKYEKTYGHLRKNSSIIAERVSGERNPQEYGIIAQLGEHLPYKQRVIGSSPIGPISMKSLHRELYMAG